jgi:hypothetical protein
MQLGNQRFFPGMWNIGQSNKLFNLLILHETLEKRADFGSPRLRALRLFYVVSKYQH